MKQIERRLDALCRFVADDAAEYLDGRRLDTVTYDPTRYADIVHLPFNPDAPLLMLTTVFRGVLQPYLRTAHGSGKLELPQAMEAVCLVTGRFSGLHVRGVAERGYGQLSVFLTS